jgi:hypothetical protein
MTKQGLRVSTLLMRLGTSMNVMLQGLTLTLCFFPFAMLFAAKDTVRGTNAVINCILMTTLLTAYAYLVS